MSSYRDIKKLAKEYKRIADSLPIIERALNGGCGEVKKLEKRNIKTDRRTLMKMQNYIHIYMAIFNKNLNRLDNWEKHIVTEIYIKGKSVCNFCINNYISDTEIYRILRKFDMYFYYDILNTSRIIKLLKPLAQREKRR